MATYRMSDGTVVKTENASAHWDEETRWNGNNWISKATGTQWEHETLYKSRKGRYWVEHESQWQGSTPHAEWVSNEEPTSRHTLKSLRKISGLSARTLNGRSCTLTGKRQLTP